MKRKKVMSLLLGAVLSIPLAVGIVGCNNTSPNIPAKATVKAKDVYAMSAYSSVSFLQKSQTQSANLKTPNSNYILKTNFSNSIYDANAKLVYSQTTSDSVTIRPATVTDENIDGIKNCLNLFDQILQNDGLSHTTEKNTTTTEQDPTLSGYNFVMTLSLPGATGFGNYKMYYNETKTETETEIENEQEEVEVSTHLEGVIVVDANQYNIVGKRTIETEGTETEASIEFTTYLNGTLNAETGKLENSTDYVKVEQSIENNEVEYEYEFCKNGKKSNKIEVEIEKKGTELELEFQLKDYTTNTPKKTRYKVEKADGSSAYTLTLTNDGIKETLTVTPTENAYTFTYTNGFTENISKV